MEANIGIKQKHLEKIAFELSKVLADEMVLYIKTRNAHWNVEGKDFYSFHKFFEDQYERLEDVIDDVAERIRSIGHYAPATMKEYLGLTKLTEESREENDGSGFVKLLLEDHEAIIIHLRENIAPCSEHDSGSADFITALMEEHEKMAWMLRAFSKK